MLPLNPLLKFMIIRTNHQVTMSILSTVVMPLVSFMSVLFYPTSIPIQAGSAGLLDNFALRFAQHKEQSSYTQTFSCRSSSPHAVDTIWLLTFSSTVLYNLSYSAMFWQFLLCHIQCCHWLWKGHRQTGSKLNLVKLWAQNNESKQQVSLRAAPLHAKEQASQHRPVLWLIMCEHP